MQKSNGADVDGFVSVEANDIISKAKKEATAIREQAIRKQRIVLMQKLASAKSDFKAKSAEFAKTYKMRLKLLKTLVIFYASI